MAGSLNDFLTTFKNGVSRPNRFDVTLNIPIVLLPYVSTSRQLNYRCEATELPGRVIETIDRKIGTAPIQKVPTLSTYNDLTMTFIVSNDMSEKVLFDSWLEAINPSSTYNFQYKANYVTDILINQYDDKNNLTYQVQLIDAYPIAVNQMDLDWSSDGYHKLTVVFAYTSWTSPMLSNIMKNIETQAISGLATSLGNSAVPL